MDSFRRLADVLADMLEPMRRREPTRPCPTLADGLALPPPPTTDVVHIDLAALRRIRLEVRTDAG